MPFKDSDFRRLVLAASRDIKEAHKMSLSPDRVSAELVMNREFVNQLQAVIASCIEADSTIKSDKTESGIKKIDLFDSFKNDPLNW